MHVVIHDNEHKLSQLWKVQLNYINIWAQPYGNKLWQASVWLFVYMSVNFMICNYLKNLSSILLALVASQKITYLLFPRSFRGCPVRCHILFTRPILPYIAVVFLLETKQSICFVHIFMVEWRIYICSVSQVSLVQEMVCHLSYWRWETRYNEIWTKIHHFA